MRAMASSASQPPRSFKIINNTGKQIVVYSTSVRVGAPPSDEKPFFVPGFTTWRSIGPGKADDIEIPLGDTAAWACVQVRFTEQGTEHRVLFGKHAALKAGDCHTIPDKTFPAPERMSGGAGETEQPPDTKRASSMQSDEFAELGDTQAVRSPRTRDVEERPAYISDRRPMQGEVQRVFTPSPGVNSFRRVTPSLAGMLSSAAPLAGHAKQRADTDSGSETDASDDEGAAPSIVGE